MLQEAEEFQLSKIQAKKRYSVTANVLSAAVANTCSGLFFMPLDLLKIKMQQTASASAQVGFFRAMQQVYSEAGVRGFYRGTLFGFVFGGVMACARLNIFSYIRHLYEQGNEWLAKRHRRITLTAIGVALTTSIPMTVSDLVRIQMNTARNSKTYSGSLEAFRSIRRDHGSRGILRGAYITFAREMVFFGTFMTIYDYLLEKSSAKLGMTLTNSLAGFVAGPASWSMIYPLDTIKTIIQSSDLSRPAPRVSQILREAAKKKQLSNLYRGLPSVVLRSAPINMIFLNSWQASLSVMLKFEDMLSEL